MTWGERFIMRCVDDALDADRPKATVDSVLRTAARIAGTYMIGFPPKAIANDL